MTTRGYTRGARVPALVLLTLVVAAVSSADPMPPDACEPNPGCITGLPTAPVRILSYNTFLIPFVSQDRRARAEEITDIICKQEPDYDIVAFQEVFEISDFKTLCDGYPHQARGPNDSGFLEVLGSGLRLASRHPIVRTDTIEFLDRAGPEVLSNKGALYAEIEIPVPPHANGTSAAPTVVNVFVTHTQSSAICTAEQSSCINSAPDLLDSTWTSQFKQLNEWMDEVAVEGAPRFLLGDLNVDGFGKPSKFGGSFVYSTMMSLMPAFTDLWTGTGNAPDAPYGATFAGLANPRYQGTSDVMERLDYIVADGWVDTLGQSNLFYHTETTTNVTINTFPDATGVPLSDHYGVETNLTLSSVCCLRHPPPLSLWQLLLRYISENAFVLALTASYILASSIVACVVPYQ